MLLDQILEFSFLEELDVVGLEGKDDLGSSGDSWSIIFNDGECSSGGGLPSPLVLVFRGFGDDSDSVGDEEGGIESDTELSDHGDVSTLAECFHEGFGA